MKELEEEVGSVREERCVEVSKYVEQVDELNRMVCVVWWGVVWCGVVGWGVVWCSVVWCGLVWCGVVGCGVVWCGVVWCDVATGRRMDG